MMAGPGVTGSVITCAYGDTLASHMTWFPAGRGQEWVHLSVPNSETTAGWDIKPRWVQDAEYDPNRSPGDHTVLLGERRDYA